MVAPRLRCAVHIVFAALSSLTGTIARAQAWVPPSGTTTVSYSYQQLFVKQHFLAHGEARDRGHIRAHVLSLQASYSLSDRLSISAGLPYVVSKYHGITPHPLSDEDNGTYHSSWQDYRLDARYQLTRGTVVVTPFLASVLPSHDYTYFAHSAVGRRLREESAGVYFGTTDLFTHFRSCGCPTGTYLQGRLAYSYVERVIGYRPNHANLDLDLGYFVTEKLGVRGLASVNRTSGGVNWNYNWTSKTRTPEYVHHDQILNEQHINLGLGASYAWSDRIDLFSSVLHSFKGRNGHKLQLAASGGVAWSFGRGGR